MPAKYNQKQGNYTEHKLNQNIIFFSQSLHKLFNYASAAAIFFSISQLYVQSSLIMIIGKNMVKYKINLPLN